MDSTTKRYVTVAHVLEMLAVSERTIRRWMAGDPPRLHWIEDASGRKYIDLDDVERIQAKKPEIVQRLLPERMERIEAAVQALQREVELLKEQAAHLLARSESWSPGADHPRRVRGSSASQGGAEARGYPPGTVRLVDFARQHQISLGEIKELHWLRGGTVVSVHERANAQRNGREWWITPDQHRTLIEYYQQQGKPHEACDLCRAT
jgi:hypothetical protein